MEVTLQGTGEESMQKVGRTRQECMQKGSKELGSKVCKKRCKELGNKACKKGGK